MIKLKFEPNTRGKGFTSKSVKVGKIEYVFNIRQRRKDKKFYVNQQTWDKTNKKIKNPTGWSEKLIALGFFNTVTDTKSSITKYINKVGK